MAQDKFKRKLTTIFSADVADAFGHPSAVQKLFAPGAAAQAA